MSMTARIIINLVPNHVNVAACLFVRISGKTTSIQQVELLGNGVIRSI